MSPCDGGKDWGIFSHRIFTDVTNVLTYVKHLEQCEALRRYWVSGLIQGSYGDTQGNIQLCTHDLSTQSCPTLWPQGLEPARLLWPRDSPGKNTGVGCHFLLQGIQGSNPGLPDPGIKPRSSALAGGFFTIWATKEAQWLSSIPLYVCTGLAKHSFGFFCTRYGKSWTNFRANPILHFFTHSSGDGHGGCFHVLAIVNGTAPFPSHISPGQA